MICTACVAQISQCILIYFDSMWGHVGTHTHLIATLRSHDVNSKDHFDVSKGIQRQLKSRWLKYSILETLSHVLILGESLPERRKVQPSIRKPHQTSKCKSISYTYTIYTLQNSSYSYNYSQSCKTVSWMFLTNVKDFKCYPGGSSIVIIAGFCSLPPSGAMSALSYDEQLLSAAWCFFQLATAWSATKALKSCTHGGPRPFFMQRRPSECPKKLKM